MWWRVIGRGGGGLEGPGEEMQRGFGGGKAWDIKGRDEVLRRAVICRIIALLPTCYCTLMHT